MELRAGIVRRGPRGQLRDPGRRRATGPDCSQSLQL